MAKQSGLGDRLYWSGNDLSGNISAIDGAGGGPALLDVTDITQSAHSRIGGLRDGTMSVTSWFDNSLQHPVMSALPTADAILTYLRGAALGGPAACLNAKQATYSEARGADGSLTVKTEGQGSKFGLEWGVQLTAGTRTDTEATDGTDVDGGASSAFGAQASLHAVSFAGTDATVEVEHSADGASWSTLMSFTQITGAAPLAERISVSGSTAVSRHVRATTVTTDGFTSLAFAVVLVRNLTAVGF
jgi:hypothetical protein